MLARYIYRGQYVLYIYSNIDIDSHCMNCFIVNL